MVGLYIWVCALALYRGVSIGYTAFFLFTLLFIRCGVSIFTMLEIPPYMVGDECTLNYGGAWENNSNRAHLVNYTLNLIGFVVLTYFLVL